MPRTSQSPTTALVDYFMSSPLPAAEQALEMVTALVAARRRQGPATAVRDQTAGTRPTAVTTGVVLPMPPGTATPSGPGATVPDTATAPAAAARPRSRRPTGGKRGRPRKTSVAPAPGSLPGEAPLPMDAPLPPGTDLDLSTLPAPPEGE